MTQMKIKLHRKDDEPIEFLPPAGLVAQAQDNITVLLVEGGMKSGEPSVCLLGVSKDGVGVIIETSLDKFLMAAQATKAMAETQLGWVMPDGYAALDASHIHEALYHKNPDAPDILGTPCFDKTCAVKHHKVIWSDAE